MIPLMIDSRPSSVLPAMNKHSLSPVTVDSSQHSGVSSDDAIAILPKRTRVIVTGNNRTKRALIGREGVIKKAVGLGGWHFLVLENGEEVKLQRNALQVVEYGPDEQDSSSDEMTETREPRIDEPEILTRPRIRRPPKALSPVPDIFKHGGAGVKSSSQYASLVNLSKLEVVSLMRYSRVFQLPDVDAAAPKDELVGAAQRHFVTQVVEEGQVLCDFKAALRRRFKQQQLMMQQYPSHYAHMQYPQAPSYPSSSSRQLGSHY